MAEGVVARNLPSALPDNPNIQVAARRGRYAETIVDQLMPWRAKMAEEGSYFTARNPTVGTAVVSAISTSYSDTASFLFILQNTDQPSNPAGKSIFLDFFSLVALATLPTGSPTTLYFLATKGTTNRLPTTAAQYTEMVPVSSRKASGRTPVCRAYGVNATAATCIASAAGSDYTVGRCIIPTGVAVSGDIYTVTFGTDPGNTIWQGGAAARATDNAIRAATMPAIIIDPGEFCRIARWYPAEATNGLSFEWELGWYER